MKSFTKGLLNAIDDMCFDMFCVCKTLWNCVTKPQTCVWEQMASLGKSLEEWISWLFRVHVKVQTGCPPEREREREKTHAKTPKSAFLVSLQVATASPKETIWICNVWFIVNQPNQFKTLYWWLKSWWRVSCFAEGCLWSAWLPLNFAWHRCEASNAANTLRYFALLVAQHVKVMDRILNNTLHWAHAKNLRPAAFGIVYVFVMTDFTPTTNDRQQDIVSNSNVNCLGVCLVGMNWANGD